MCALRDLIDIGYTFCGTRVVKIFLYLVLPEYLFSSIYRLEDLQQAKYMGYSIANNNKHIVICK